MKTEFFAVCLVLFVVQSRCYVILDSCPPGCECFHRNSVVECREAHLKKIPVLKFARNVKRLVLRGNEIKKIEPHSLKSYKNLEYLDLSDNEISMLSGKVFDHNHLLREVNLGLNPFECDCNLRGFIETLQTYHKNGGMTLRNPDLTNCAGPQTFMAKPLLGIMFQDQDRNVIDETMYIGEEDNRGIAICPVKQRAPPHHAMLKAKPTSASTIIPIQLPPNPATKSKKKSPNFALITASVTAAVLVTCITSVSVAKHLLKNNRWRIYRDKFLAYFKRKPVAEKGPSTFSEHIKKQRRASCGYAASDCSSDEEITASPQKKGKDGYIAVPTAESRDLADVALDDSG